MLVSNQTQRLILVVPSILHRLIQILSLEQFEVCPNSYAPKYFDKNERKHVEDNEPVKILKLRYAKGEITKEEFEQMKKDIS